jgi:hypothetical protein
MFRATARRQIEATEVSASARQFKEQVHQAFKNLIAAQLQEGETMPDLSFLQELIGRLLDSGSSAVSEIDGRYTSQLVTVAALRAQRDDLVAKLRDRIRDVRYLLSRSVAGGVFKAALRDRRVSKVKPLSLLQGARDLVAILRDPELAVGAADPALAVSAVAFAAALEADAAQLEPVLAQLAALQRAKQGDLGAKVADLRAAAETNRRCAELLFSLYRVVGLDFHAERVRPKNRRKRVEEPEIALAPPSPGASLGMG